MKEWFHVYIKIEFTIVLLGRVRSRIIPISIDARAGNDDDDDPFNPPSLNDNPSFASTIGDETTKMDEDNDADNGTQSSVGEIPKWISKSVAADVKELDELQYVTAEYSLTPATGDIQVFIAIAKERFQLSSERAQAYMIDQSKDICFRFTFGETYCGDQLDYQRNQNEVKPTCPEVDANIVQATVPSRKYLNASIFRTNDKCAMSWYLENRIKMFFQGDAITGKAGCWPPRLLTRGHERPIIKRFIRSEVRTLMNRLDCNEDVAKALLKECGEDVQVALDFQVDNYDRFMKIVEACERSGGDDDEGDEAMMQPPTLTRSESEAMVELKKKVSKETSEKEKTLKRLEEEFEVATARAAAFTKKIVSTYHVDDVDEDAMVGALLQRNGDEERALNDIIGYLVPPKQDTSSGSDDAGSWEWDNGGTWTMFDSATQADLEKGYAAFRSSGTQTIEFVIKAINKTYVADFKRMKQKNKASNFERNIRRSSKYAAELQAWKQVRVVS